MRQKQFPQLRNHNQTKGNCYSTLIPRRTKAQRQEGGGRTQARLPTSRCGRPECQTQLDAIKGGGRSGIQIFSIQSALMISSGTGMTTLLRPIPLQYNMRLHIKILRSIKWNKRHLSVVKFVPCPLCSCNTYLVIDICHNWSYWFSLCFYHIQ